MGETSQPDFSPYEKLAILREEMAQRGKELTALERSIRIVQETMARRKYLWGLYPDFYKELPPPDGAKDLPGLLEQRRALEGLVGRLAEEQTSVETALRSGVAGGTPAAKAAQPAPQPQTQQPVRKARFASFDDFSAQKRQSHGST